MIMEMEGREDTNSSGVSVTTPVILTSDAAPSDSHNISPKAEPSPPPITSSTLVTGSALVTDSTLVTGSELVTTGSTHVNVPPPLGVMPLSMKKKRGRPRKYGLDGSPTITKTALSPKPISSAGSSPVIDFSAGKRGKVRLPSAGKYHQQSPKIGLESLGDWFPCSVGANFTPHIINVNAGEDVTMKVISFSQQGPRAICILSANGIISSVTLRQPNSSGGTLTYEGRFEILSLAGSFMPSEIGGIKNRSGGMSVSLASPDGRVVGGGVAGLLVAASPVQIVVGSFLTGNPHEQQKTPRKPIISEAAMATVLPPAAANVTSAVEPEEPSPATVKPDVSSLSFRGDNWSSYNAPESRQQSTDINVSLNG